MKTQMPTDLFIEKLIKRCEDRGNRAELRRFWSSTTRHHAFAHLGYLQALGDQKKPDAYTAAFYSVHPLHAQGNSVGAACRRLASSTGFESFERHFRRLLASDSLDDVADQLHRILKRLERESIPLDYEKLLCDLRNWKKNADDVKTRWARDFWQVPQEEKQDGTTESSS